MSAGNIHSCALRADGSLSCWGSNLFNEVDPIPNGPFKVVSAGTGLFTRLYDFGRFPERLLRPPPGWPHAFEAALRKLPAAEANVLRLLYGPTSGRITIRGRVSSLLEVGTGFHPELTGRENIYLNGAILGMQRAEIDRKFGR